MRKNNKKEYGLFIVGILGAGFTMLCIDLCINSRNIYDRFANAGIYLLFGSFILILFSVLAGLVFYVSHLLIYKSGWKRRRGIKLLSLFLGIIFAVGFFLILLIPRVNGNIIWSYIIVTPILLSFINSGTKKVI